MAHYYDREYDLEDEKKKANRGIQFYNDEINKFNLFIEQVTLHKIEIPDTIQREINNRLLNFNHYIEKDNEIINKANKFISQGKRHLDMEEFHFNFS